MTNVVADISMSLDGYVTGPDPDLEHGLGHGGEPLHTWAVSSRSQVDAEVLHDATEASGAVVMGRRLVDIVDGLSAGTTRWATARGWPGHRRSSSSPTPSRSRCDSGWSSRS